MRIFLFSLLSLYSVAGLAIDESKLWLPLSYMDFMPKLKEAAELEKNTGFCEKLVEGTLRQGKGTKDNPVLSVHCRTADNSTYFTLYEAKTLKEIFTQRPGAGSRGPSQKELASYWAVCKADVQKKTSVLNDRKLIKEHSDPELIETDGEQTIYRFCIDFDAVGQVGNPLKYRAICDFKSRTEYTVKVGARRENAQM
ncbi:MAG: hypothetical protein K6L73_00240 [Cellvibrionaceae bacterium]